MAAFLSQHGALCFIQITKELSNRIQFHRTARTTSLILKTANKKAVKYLKESSEERRVGLVLRELDFHADVTA